MGVLLLIKPVTDLDAYVLLPIRNGNYAIFVSCKILITVISMKIKAIICSEKKDFIYNSLISIFWGVSKILMRPLGDEF